MNECPNITAFFFCFLSLPSLPPALSDCPYETEVSIHNLLGTHKFIFHIKAVMNI